MTKPTCETCPCWGGECGTKSAPCKRNPPFVNIATLPSGDVEWFNDFPITGADDWCGEHPDFKKEK